MRVSATEMSEPNAAVSPSPAPALEVESVGKAFGAVRALRDASLVVRAGEIHGLCGHNGAGKSTLVRVLVGLEHADTGVIRRNGVEIALHGSKEAQRRGIAIVDQELSVVADLSVAENLFLGNVEEPLVRRRARERARAQELLARVGLHDMRPSQPLAELSLGERQLVEIARLLGRDASVLILDEPTATLSDAEIGRVFAAIRAVAAQGASVVFVSHRLDEVLRLCDRVTVFRDGKNVATRTSEELDKRALVALMLGEEGRETGLVERPAPTGAPVVRIKGLSVPSFVTDFSLDVRPGEIVGIAGQVGCGSTQVLRSIAGLVANAHGEVRIGETRLPLAAPRAAQALGVQFVTNDRKAEGLFLSQSIALNLTATRLRSLVRGGFLSARRLRARARGLAGLVGVDASRLSAPVETLSGGNQQKVLVARCLDRQPQSLILLDEPTRGVDVGGRADIHTLMREVAATGTPVIFASSELEEILDLSDTVVSMYASRIVSCRPRAEVDANSVLEHTTHAGEQEPER
jgi:ABC-type sugar transport system ATPase subunit